MIYLHVLPTRCLLQSQLPLLLLDVVIFSGLLLLVSAVRTSIVLTAVTGCSGIQKVPFFAVYANSTKFH